MTKTDMEQPTAKKPDTRGLMRQWRNDLLMALALLTRLPVPRADWSDDARPAARAAWAYPLVGLLVTLPAVALGYAGLALGLPTSLCALVMLIATTVATGAMHEDGVADCADGFWGGWDVSRRLEIMKDSAIGTYGVLALVAVTGAKWAALAAMLAHGGPVWLVLLPAVMSRAGMVWVMQALPNARDTGLSKQTGRPGWPATYIALAAGLIACLASPLPNMFWVLIAGILSICAVSYIARIKIGGQTGDVLGASQSICEAVLLAGMAAQLSAQ